MGSCIVDYVHRTIVNWLHSEEVGLENMKVKRGRCSISSNRAYLASTIAYAQIQLRGASDTRKTLYEMSKPAFGKGIFLYGFDFINMEVRESSFHSSKSDKLI